MQNMTKRRLRMFRLQATTMATKVCRGSRVWFREASSVTCGEVGARDRVAMVDSRLSGRSWSGQKKMTQKPPLPRREKLER
jgi:hypothetical protein